MITRAPRYDPFEHAAEMEIEIVERPLRTANGLWVPEHRVVFLQRGLHRIHKRSTLAHELVHAEYGDVGRSEKQERRADRVASRRLICGIDLEMVVDTSDDPGVWAMELNVTDHLMNVFLHERRIA